MQLTRSPEAGIKLMRLSDNGDTFYIYRPHSHKVYRCSNKLVRFLNKIEIFLFLFTLGSFKR
jgi:hypothetical protein